MKYIIRHCATDEIVAMFKCRAFAEDFHILLFKRSPSIRYVIEEKEV